MASTFTVQGFLTRRVQCSQHRENLATNHICKYRSRLFVLLCEANIQHIIQSFLKEIKAQGQLLTFGKQIASTKLLSSNHSPLQHEAHTGPILGACSHNDEFHVIH